MDNTAVHRDLFDSQTQPFRLAAWPTSDEVIYWEYQTINYALDLTLTYSPDRFMRELSKPPLQLLRHEALQLLHLARAQATQLTQASTAQNKAMMELRLQRYIQDNHNLDPRAELQALKQLSLVQGLTSDPDQKQNPFKNLMQVIQDTTDKRLSPSHSHNRDDL